MTDTKAKDLTGREQFTRNVLVSGGTHFFVIIAGFIVPRQISDNLGQNSLGIWDLGWATLQYMSVGSLGVEGALSRWVSFYRAEGSQAGLVRVTTAAFIWQCFVALLVMLAFFIMGAVLNKFITLDSVAEYESASLVFLFMGITLAIRLIAGAPGAVITGCHRFDIQSTIGGLQDFGLAIVLTGALFAGATLPDLALAVLVVELFAGLVRVVYSRKLCPEARVKVSAWEKSVSKEMLSFGIKNLVVNIQQIMVVQSVAILLASFAGPAVLSVFNRGMALIRMIEQIVRKLSYNFMPMASGLAGGGQRKEAEGLVLVAGKFSFALALPMGLALIFWGDLLLKIWMGDAYANKTMMVLLVLGAVLPIAQAGPVSALVGLNQHGGVAKYGLLMTLIALAISIPLATTVGWNVISAAMVVGFSWTVGRVIALVMYVRTKFGIGVWAYIREVILVPLLCSMPLMAGLYVGRLLTDNASYFYSALAVVAGSCLFVIAYWNWLLPIEFREKVRQWFSSMGLFAGR